MQIKKQLHFPLLVPVFTVKDDDTFFFFSQNFLTMCLWPSKLLLDMLGEEKEAS